MTRPVLASLVASSALLLWGCPGSLENPERFEGGTGGCDAEQLLAQSCGANAICHDADAPQGGLDLVSPGVAGRVVDVAPGLCTMSNDYVVSADPSSSFLLDKLTASPSCGAQMPPPPEAPLTPEQLTCITNWVNDISGGGGGTDAGGMDGGTDASDGATP